MDAKICDNCHAVIVTNKIISINRKQMNKAWANNHNLDFCSKKCCIEYLEHDLIEM